MIARLVRRVLGDWWTPVTDGQTWGIYHPTRRHQWRYGLTKREAVIECRRRNSGLEYACCKKCGFTYAAHGFGQNGGIVCP